jgi:ubiquinone/menaquinone biosynthesis C-methylase UbiE
VAKLKDSVKTVSEHWRNSPYYTEAEQWTWVFWNEDRPFRRFFERLDLESVLELACGHGRHAEQMSARAGKLILMDVLPENIDACKRRLAARKNVEYAVNNGFDFRPVPDAECSAVFCYDAMVHFSPDLIESYLSDTVRVLRPGGMALYHHSNYAAPDDRHYGENPHARNRMTKAQFATYAERAGLTVVEQIVMDWGNVPDLDCLSLLQRPAR